LIRDLIRKEKIAAEFEHPDEEETDTSENDAFQANKAWERRQAKLSDPAFPIPTHAIVRLYTPPPNLGYHEPFKAARIEIVIAQSNARAWIDGKPLYANKLTATAITGSGSL
jgi:hypothetical protein